MGASETYGGFSEAGPSVSDTPTPLRPCCSIIFDDDREEDRGVAEGILAGVGDSEGEDEEQEVLVDEAVFPRQLRRPMLQHARNGGPIRLPVCLTEVDVLSAWRVA